MYSDVKSNYEKEASQRLTMSLKDIELELGISRKTASAFAKTYLHFKKIGRRYVFSRREFEEVIEAKENIIYELTY